MRGTGRKRRDVSTLQPQQSVGLAAAAAAAAAAMMQ
jgi:hypothetical protein